MKDKVSELEGALLDAAVAMAEGAPKRHYGAQEWIEVRGGKPLWFTDDGNGSTSSFRPWLPSSSWRDGGPIIERERITVAAVGKSAKFWIAEIDGIELDTAVEVGYGEYSEEGPTPLIAAMRAYVASKFGDTVEIPA